MMAVNFPGEQPGGQKPSGPGSRSKSAQGSGSISRLPAGPYIESSDSVSRSMWEVALALLPATAASVLFFGPWSLYLVFASAFASALMEQPFVPGGFSIKNPLGDGSAFLAGMLFGLTLAPGTPWWIPFFGAGIVVFAGKQLFGGIGNNIFNPALVARAVLIIAYPAMVTGWRLPLQYDVITSATPLEGAAASYLDLFLGNVAGSIGETSALAFLIGAAYLYARGFLGWRISVAYIVSAFITALILGIDPIFTILSGSLMFAALFMSTDMVTSPVARSARYVYGIGCGVLTVLIREFTVFPEGVTFAVLFMNGMTPLIDVTVVDTFFGQLKERSRYRAGALTAAVVLVIAVAAGFGTEAAGSFADSYYVDGTIRRDISLFFPDGKYADPFDSEIEGVKAERIFSKSEELGFLVYTSADGYKGPVRLVTAFDSGKRIIGIRVLEQKESPTLGKLVRRPTFLGQFLRRFSDNPEAATENLASISGATISSRAVAQAVETALRFAEKPSADRGTAPGAADLDLLNLPDGTYTGSSGGYQGRIEVEVTVSGGRIRGIEILSHQETARISEPAFGRLTSSIMERQRLDIDTISGATGSSRGFLAAVRTALSR